VQIFMVASPDSTLHPHNVRAHSHPFACTAPYPPPPPATAYTFGGLAVGEGWYLSQAVV
jgi:hypothetical protein